MKKFWLKTLWFILGKLVGDQSLLTDIKEFVNAAFNTTLSGDEKKALVRTELAHIGHDLAAIGNSLVNLAIEAAVALAKAKVEAK